MFSFRQKIFINYAAVFFLFILLLFPFVSQWVHYIVMNAMEDRATEIISNIQKAPNNEALIRRLKDQKSLVFFRVGVISDEQKVLYDSHTKRLLGPRFSQDYVVDHPEVMQAFQEGVGYHEEYSALLDQKFAYFAKSFNFHGRIYVLRTAFPHQFVIELSQNFEFGFLGFSIAVLLLFSFMTWFIIHYLTRPIQRIITAVRPYQLGTETVLPAIEMGEINPNDEVAKLALTLNCLSAKIQKHIDTLTAERNEKEAILESLGEGVIAVDENMKITYVNHMAFKLLGLKNQNLAVQSLDTLHQQQYVSLLQRCQLEKRLLTDTVEFYLEGKKVYLDAIAAPKKENEGAILVLQDQTAHYKIFEMRRDFIANASHELKTPITIIRGFAEALHDNPELPQNMVEEITSKIVRNCHRMTVLIKDLLTLADIDNIPMSRLSECDLHELTVRCCTMLAEVFPDAMIEIDKEQGHDMHLIVDPHLLELAMMNLIENAAKYSSRPAKIAIKFEQLTQAMKISVTDQGIGIPAADQEHIFERFYTVDKAHSQKMGGSGLGLSIVKTIVEKHFGTIHLASELGKGSIFTLIIPKRDIQLNE
jgi:two-component system phosphate regulon sensor histidine kinase PhoR